MRHNTSLYISGKASNRRRGLKLLLFHEVPFGGNKPFTMCENPLKRGGYKMLTTKTNVKFIVSLIGMKLFSLGMKLSF